MLRRKPFLRWARTSSGAALGQLLRSGWAERHYFSPEVMAELSRRLREQRRSAAREGLNASEVRHG